MLAPNQQGRWGANYAGVISNTYHRNRRTIALGLLKTAWPLNGLCVFDFGCGEGALLRELSATGAITSGCDPSSELVALAPAGTMLGGVECLEAAPDASFDVLIALNVLSYLTEDEVARFWIAARRIVKPKGHLLHTVPNQFGSKPNRDHFWTENPATYPGKLKALGFTEIGRAFNGYYPRIFKWHRLSAMIGWDRIAKRFGFWSRGGRIYHPWRLALAPEQWLMRRSTGYVSLSRRAL